MNEEYSFRVLRPLSDVWVAMSHTMVRLFPVDHIGEMARQYRHSVTVAGLQSYTVVTWLTFESDTSTLLTVYVNDRPYSKWPRIQAFRKRAAHRIYNGLMQVLEE